MLGSKLSLILYYQTWEVQFTNKVYHLPGRVHEIYLLADVPIQKNFIINDVLIQGNETRDSIIGKVADILKLIIRIQIYL